MDSNDYAVARIEAEPAKNPSFWISKTSIHHRYLKVGDFWLPAENISKTEVRLGEVATLSIEYQGYTVSTLQGKAPIGNGTSHSSMMSDVSDAKLVSSWVVQ